VVEAGPCTVLQKKTVDKDGYEAVVTAFGEIKENRVTKPAAGPFKKVHAAPKKYVRELHLPDYDAVEVGRDITCDIFAEGDAVDVSGLTKGRGFTGAIQRWNSARSRMTHGGGPVHRSPGSLGAHSDPSRVFKGKHMAGQYGHENVTIQNLEIVKVDKARNVLLIKGGIPGPKGSLIKVKLSVKSK